MQGIEVGGTNSVLRAEDSPINAEVKEATLPVKSESATQVRTDVERPEKEGILEVSRALASTGHTCLLADQRDHPDLRLNMSDCANSRGTTLLSVPGKV